MPRKAHSPVAPPANDWFIRDWMHTLGVTQSKLSDLTGWSKATVNDIYHGRTSYYRQILNDLAFALNLQPWELLMHPDDAMAIRQLTAAVRVVEKSKNLRAPETDAPEPENRHEFG